MAALQDSDWKLKAPLLHLLLNYTIDVLTLNYTIDIVLHINTASPTLLNSTLLYPSLLYYSTIVPLYNKHYMVVHLLKCTLRSANTALKHWSAWNATVFRILIGSWRTPLYLVQIFPLCCRLTTILVCRLLVPSLLPRLVRNVLSPIQAYSLQTCIKAVQAWTLHCCD